MRRRFGFAAVLLGGLLAASLTAGCLAPRDAPEAAAAAPKGAADPAASDSPLQLHFLDVGQGDAVLIRGPDGRSVLYDGGPRGSGTVELLRGLGVEDLELVIASHNHADHIGGLEEVIRAFSPRFYMDNGVPYTTLTYARVLDAVEGAGSELMEPTLRTITLGDVRLRIVPPPGGEADEQNVNSVGVRVEYGDFAAFLGGDAEPPQWAWWLEAHPDELRPVHVHKASHHGSRNGDTPAGIEALRPDVVVIGVGATNTYGHPHPWTLARYREIGARVHRTDRDGTILVEAGQAGGFEVRSGRAAADVPGQGESAPAPVRPAPPPAGVPPPSR